MSGKIILLIVKTILRIMKTIPCDFFFLAMSSRLVSDGYLIHTNYGRTQITKNLPRLTGFKFGRF